MNRIYGLSFIVAEMTSWNNDTSGDIRRLNNGNIWATDVSRKFSIRNSMEKYLNKNVFMKRVYDIEKESYKTLQDLFSEYFDSKENKNIKDFFQTYLDIRLFGACLTTLKTKSSTKTKQDKEKNYTFNFTGSVQFLDAMDILKENNFINKDIIGINNAKENESTFGYKQIVERAVFCYPFIMDYNNYKENCGYVGIQDENEIIKMFHNDYEDLKKIIGVDVSNLNSCTKSGCFNLCNVFIETTSNNDIVDINAIKNKIEIKYDDKESSYILNLDNIKKEVNKNFKLEINPILKNLKII